MSLDAAKLEKARELAGGIVQARCPACAEGGGDRKGEHLRVYPDGRYGCCVHPKDGEHRKRIFALAGIRKAGTFTLRLKTPPALPTARSVKAALTAFSSGTLGTPKTESENGVPSVPTPPSPVSGTLGTGNSELRARARVDSPTAHIDIGEDFDGELKDTESAVPSVPSVPGVGVAEPPSAAGEHLPYLTPGGTLVIPFDSPERYHWWKPPHDQRLRVKQTLAEVKERMKHAVTV
jgi:hypothetical protein